jgi:hypothetical protein
MVSHVSIPGICALMPVGRRILEDLEWQLALAGQHLEPVQQGR